MKARYSGRSIITNENGIISFKVCKSEKEKGFVNLKMKKGLLNSQTALVLSHL